MPTETETYIENAIRWALERLDSTDYPLLCLAFVEDAYERGNDIVLDGYSDAGEAGDAYGAAGHPGLPPRGALAFYECRGEIKGVLKNWGHVGISLGEGRVIHAWGRVRIDPYLEIESLEPPAGWTKPVYIGWAPLEVVMKGMKSIS